MSVAILFAVFFLAVAMNVFGIVGSRGGRTKLHNVALFLGLAGLLAVPVIVFSFFSFARQFMFFSATSPAGIAFHASGVIAVVCGVASATAAVALARRRSLRGAV
jgi:hypothetical protein